MLCAVRGFIRIFRRRELTQIALCEIGKDIPNTCLIGALANRTNEENQKLYDRMINTMLNKLGYCRTCAQKTIEYFCTQEDEK